jgi:hypothetical protein
MEHHDCDPPKDRVLVEDLPKDWTCPDCSDAWQARVLTPQPRQRLGTSSCSRLAVPRGRRGVGPPRSHRRVGQSRRFPACLSTIRSRQAGRVGKPRSPSHGLAQPGAPVHERGRRIAPASLSCLQGGGLPALHAGLTVHDDRVRPPRLSASWGGLYWRCRASFGPPIESQAAV